MPKALSRSPLRRRGTRTDGQSRGGSIDVLHLHQRIADQRDLVDCTQRAVARGRRTIVDTQGRLLEFRGAPREEKSGEGRRTEVRHRLAELVTEIETSHQRLLLLSAHIEMESDRLDMLRSELDRLTAAAEAMGHRT
jgi:hypothetical protein